MDDELLLDELVTEANVELELEELLLVTLTNVEDDELD